MFRSITAGRRLARRGLGLLATLALACSVAHASGTVGTTLPEDFPVILDASLGTPLLGFGASGPVRRTPVVFVHGNNDTPYPTSCNPYGRMQALAQFLADHGYATSELWGVGYQGDQCDLLVDPTIRSSQAHTTVANVPDVGSFIEAVLAYTGARQVDLVGHSLGVVIIREWLREHPRELRKVRRIVGIDGANHGIIDCSPDPANYWQLPANGGFTPSSAICQELGSPQTPFLQQLNRHESFAAHRTLVIRNADRSFVYFPVQDGLLAPVPAIDAYGNPTDFSGSARQRGALTLNLTNQGVNDPILGTSHLGILNSTETWNAVLSYLQRP
ncbi:MAG: alpha/beta fold hydrolase [Proteobacteria bacterium]|nr:alpha/beta fold hydrolase [Pseudomonadota bacterium]